jgi:hypothetical protein
MGAFTIRNPLLLMTVIPSHGSWLYKPMVCCCPVVLLLSSDAMHERFNNFWLKYLADSSPPRLALELNRPVLQVGFRNRLFFA